MPIFTCKTCGVQTDGTKKDSVKGLCRKCRDDVHIAWLKEIDSRRINEEKGGKVEEYTMTERLIDDYKAKMDSLK
jgi:hypothetical protein